MLAAESEVDMMSTCDDALDFAAKLEADQAVDSQRLAQTLRKLAAESRIVKGTITSTNPDLENEVVLASKMQKWWCSCGTCKAARNKARAAK